MSLYTHWACFDCRKSFHYLPATKQARIGHQCPDCGKAMSDMGRYFEPPRMRARKAWAIMELLSRSGYRFATEGSKAFLGSFILMTKNPTLEGVRRRIELHKEEKEASRIKARMKMYKEGRKHRRKQAAV